MIYTKKLRYTYENYQIDKYLVFFFNYTLQVQNGIMFIKKLYFNLNVLRLLRLRNLRSLEIFLI